MNYRAVHQFDRYNTHCTRCGASRSAIEDGFVNVLCRGRPIGKGGIGIEVKLFCAGCVSGALLVVLWLYCST